MWSLKYAFAHQAQTGSGKTLAFLLPILNYLVGKTHKKNDILSIILSPTHELAQQTYGILQRIIKNLKGTITHQLIIGGNSLTKDLENYQSGGCNVIVATPKKLCGFL